MKKSNVFTGSAPALATKADKKAYEPPELIEWGTIRDLTLGKGGGQLDAISYES